MLFFVVVCISTYRKKLDRIFTNEFRKPSSWNKRKLCLFENVCTLPALPTTSTVGKLNHQQSDMKAIIFTNVFTLDPNHA